MLELFKLYFFLIMFSNSLLKDTVRVLSRNERKKKMIPKVTESVKA